MKRLLIPMVIILICSVVVIGCSSTTTSTPTTPAQTTSNPAPTNTTAAAVQTTSAPTPTTTAAASNIQKGGKMTILLNQMASSPIGMPSECFGPTSWSQFWSEEGPLTQGPDGKLGYKLADSADYDMSKDNSGITIHLKKGIKFIDGTELNAQAMKWNLDMLQKYALYGGTTNWKSWDVVDDYTVRISYKEWRNAMYTDMMEADMSFMVSPTAFQKNGLSWMEWNMVGTGPFMQKDFQKDQSLTLVKNPNYWQAGKPYLDEVDILYVADLMTSEAMMKSGGADVLWIATPKQANDLQKAGFNVISRVEGTNALIPDSGNASSPWSNLQVRQAAEYAIDKANLAKVYGYGYWKPAYEVADPIESAIYDPNFAGRTYDTAKAKQLLTAAGYPNGFKTTIFASSGTDQNMISSIQSDLSKVGIQADLQFPEAAKFNDIMYGSGWTNGLVYTGLFSSFNMANSLVFYFTSAPTGSCFKPLQRPAGFDQAVINTMYAPLADPTVPVGDIQGTKAVVQTIFDNVMAIPLTYGASLCVDTNKVQNLNRYAYFRNWACNPENFWMSK